MAAGNFANCLTVVLKYEGGWVNDPAGGPTNLGVTLPALQTWLGAGRVATVQDIKDLTPATVAPIYQKGFWGAIHADYIPKGIDLCLFDFAVNAGPSRAIMEAQKALGIPSDGLVGPVTLTTMMTMPADEAIATISTARLVYYQMLPNFSAFGHGWMTRIAGIEADAKAMALLSA